MEGTRVDFKLSGALFNILEIISTKAFLSSVPIGMQRLLLGIEPITLVLSRRTWPLRHCGKLTVGWTYTKYCASHDLPEACT